MSGKLVFFEREAREHKKERERKSDAKGRERSGSIERKSFFVYDFNFLIL